MTTVEIEDGRPFGKKQREPKFEWDRKVIDNARRRQAEARDGDRISPHVWAELSDYLTADEMPNIDTHHRRIMRRIALDNECP